MLFNVIDFTLFLPVVFLLYYLIAFQNKYNSADSFGMNLKEAMVYTKGVEPSIKPVLIK